jgi:hypothetical protein
MITQRRRRMIREKVLLLRAITLEAILRLTKSDSIQDMLALRSGTEN